LPTNVQGLDPNLEDWLRKTVEPRVQPVTTVSITFDATDHATVDEKVRHQLGKIPQGYRVVKRSAAGSVYDGSAANDRNFLYLRSDTASLTVELEIF
jgi:hypothetical protein